MDLKERCEFLLHHFGDDALLVIPVADAMDLPLISEQSGVVWGLGHFCEFKAKAVLEHLKGQRA